MSTAVPTITRYEDLYPDQPDLSKVEVEDTTSTALLELLGEVENTRDTRYLAVCDYLQELDVSARVGDSVGFVAKAEAAVVDRSPTVGDHYQIANAHSNLRIFEQQLAAVQLKIFEREYADDEYAKARGETNEISSKYNRLGSKHNLSGPDFRANLRKTLEFKRAQLQSIKSGN